MADTADTGNGADPFETRLQDLADRLRRLRVERGEKSLRQIAKRAEQFDNGVHLSLPTLSTGFNGERLLPLDKLILLVRTLLSWDINGDETVPPARTDPVLAEWREWRQATAELRPRRRRTPATQRPVPDAPSAIPASAVARQADRPPHADADTGTSTNDVPLAARPRRKRLGVALAAHTQRGWSLDGFTSVEAPHIKEPPVEAVEKPESGAAKLARLTDSARRKTPPPRSPIKPPEPATRKPPLEVRMPVLQPAHTEPQGPSELSKPSLAVRSVLHAIHAGRVALPPLDTGPARAICFSPTNSLMAVGGDAGVQFWDPATSSPVGEPLTKHGQVYAMAFSPTGRLFASGSSDGSVRLWAPTTQTSVGVLTSRRPTYTVCAVAFSPDGTLLATGSPDGTTRLWDTATQDLVGDPLPGRIGSLSAVAFSPDGTLLATGSPDGTARLWDPTTHTSVGSPLTTQTGSVCAMAFSPDSSLLATGSTNGTVQLWDPTTRNPIGDPLIGHTDSVHTVAFSPDGTLLATGSLDCTARLWDPTTHTSVRRRLTPHTGSVCAMAFSPDSSLLATSSDVGTVLLSPVLP
ncbi:WD40 repeat domain-containing protein [Streptomyces sp. NPDC001414]